MIDQHTDFNLLEIQFTQEDLAVMDRVTAETELLYMNADTADYYAMRNLMDHPYRLDLVNIGLTGRDRIDTHLGSVEPFTPPDHASYAAMQGDYGDSASWGEVALAARAMGAP